MHEAQRYFNSLLELPVAENADLWLTVADELWQLQHVEEVRVFVPLPHSQPGDC